MCAQADRECPGLGDADEGEALLQTLYGERNVWLDVLVAPSLMCKIFEAMGRHLAVEARGLPGEHHRHRAAHTLGVLALGDVSPALGEVEGQREVVVGRVRSPRRAAEEADKVALVRLPRVFGDLVVAVERDALPPIILFEPAAHRLKFSPERVLPFLKLGAHAAAAAGVYDELQQRVAERRARLWYVQPGEAVVVRRDVLSARCWPHVLRRSHRDGRRPSAIIAAGCGGDLGGYGHRRSRQERKPSYGRKRRCHCPDALDGGGAKEYDALLRALAYHGNTSKAVSGVSPVHAFDRCRPGVPCPVPDIRLDVGSRLASERNTNGAIRELYSMHAMEGTMRNKQNSVGI